MCLRGFKEGKERKKISAHCSLKLLNLKHLYCHHEVDNVFKVIKVENKSILTVFMHGLVIKSGKICAYSLLNVKLFMDFLRFSFINYN